MLFDKVLQSLFVISASCKTLLLFPVLYICILFGTHHQENIQSRCIHPLSFEAKLLNWRCFPCSAKLLSIFLPFTHSHCCPSLYEMRCVCQYALIYACAHACMSKQFDFSLCIRVKRTWRHVPFLSRPSSVQLLQGLSRARIKGAKEEEKVLPQLIWPLWGEGTLFPLMLWTHG